MVIFGWTLLFTFLLVGISIAGLWALYRSTWRGPQRWMEATRHKHKLALKIGRWIWFKWIHLDCQYWIVHVDFSRGPIELTGMPPESSYWSFTYNTWTEVNTSINSESVVIESDGSYKIVMGAVEVTGNWIPVRKSAKQGVIYFRIYEPPSAFPVALPEVRQNAKLLVSGALS